MESKIIFALDVYDYNTAVDLARTVGEKVFAIKIKWPVILENGIKIVRDLSKYANIICDFKLADIIKNRKTVYNNKKGREHIPTKISLKIIKLEDGTTEIILP